MKTAIQTAALGCKLKVDSWFRRVFKEQAGGAEVIATIVIVAVVLVLALAFRKNLSALVKNLWDNLMNLGKGQEPSIPSWE